MERLLENKVCLVTGASRGIGKSIAEHFSDEGAIVYANGRREGSLEGWANQLTLKNGNPVIPVYFDVTDTSKAAEVFLKIKKEQRRLDVLVNNAGITGNELIGMIREETIRKLFSTNVFAVIHMIQFASKLMRSQNSGSIINISSIIGTDGNAGEMVYSGTKGAIISMTKSAAKELARNHIRVNSVAPGFTDTDMFKTAASPEKIDYLISNIGFGRLATGGDIAEACVWLASDRACFVTGQIIGVNGATRI